MKKKIRSREEVVKEYLDSEIAIEFFSELDSRNFRSLNKVYDDENLISRMLDWINTSQGSDYWAVISKYFNCVKSLS